MKIIKDFKIRVKPFVNKNNSQVYLAVQKKKSKEFMKYFSGLKDNKKYLDLKLKRKN